MAIDKGKTLDQLMAEIQADLQTEKQRQASRPRLSLPEIPTGQAPTTKEQQEMIDKYLNAKSPLGSFLGNTLSTIAFPLNYGVLQPLGEYTDFGRWTDPNKDFLDKVAFNPFSKANELLAEGWEKDGFFGAVGELAEKGKTGGDVVAGLSSTLGYGLSRAIGSDTEEDKAFDLKYWQERQKKFKEENKAAYYGGGFGVELLTDPLNALTFGGASAVKAGASAALKEANKVAKSAGVSGKFKTVEDAVDAVYNKTVDKYTKMQPQTKALQTPASQTVTKNIDAEINRIKQAAIKKGIDPDKAQKLATQAVKSSEEPAQVVSRIDRLATEARQRAIAQIDNAARSARAKAQNRLISLDIPLTNKTVGLVNKPAFMARTADKVGERAVSVVANLTKLLEPPSANTPEALASAARVAEDRMSELLQTRYGVTKAEDLTIDAIRDLEDLFESSQRRTKELGFQTKVDEELIPEMKVAKVEDALRNVDPKVVQAIDNLLGQGYKIDEVDQIIGDARTAYNIDKDTLEILPELIRAEAKQLGMPTITPTPKPVPKSIINKFDQLFETSTKLGLENRAYDKVFTDLVDEFNSGKITKEDLLKKVDADLKSVKELVKEQKKTAKPKPTEAPKVEDLFEERLLKDTVPSPSSKVKIVMMKIDDFLKLVPPLGSIEKKAAGDIVKSGGKLNSLPMLEYKVDGKVGKVTDHEGRHRALALKEAGYKEMPVEIHSPNIRWSEQLDPNNRDYVSDFPEKLVQQGSDRTQSIAFPIKREDSASVMKPSEKLKPTRKKKEVPKIDPFLSSLFSKKQKPIEAPTVAKEVPSEPVRKFTFEERFTSKVTDDTIKKEFNGDYNKRIEDIENKIKTASDDLAKAKSEDARKSAQFRIDLYKKELDKVYLAAEYNQIKGLVKKPNVEKIIEEAIRNKKILDETVKVKTPFVDGKTFAATKSVPKEFQEIAEQWKGMLGINEKVLLVNLDDLKGLDFTGDLAFLKNTRIPAKMLGGFLKSSDGTFIVMYKSGQSKMATLELISHEMGHGLMKSQYEKASEAVRKAIDEDYEKWLVQTKGKTGKELVDMLRPYRVGKGTSVPEGMMADWASDYWKSKDEWFADQVARWATTSEKPMSVVEKFFFRLAQAMKRFFQANKQYLPSKTMEDWLNGLEKTAKQSIQPATEPLDMKFAKSELDSKTVPNETPQVKQKTTEPSNVITPEKKKYFEMLRSTLQPTGIPQVVQGMDKEFVKQMEQVAKRLEEMKPIRILDDQKQLKRKELALTPVLDAEGKAKKIAVPVQKVETKKVNGETVYVTSGRDYVPFEKLRKMPEFVQDMGGLTPVGRWYRSSLLSRVFTARSLGLGDAFVNSYGDLIQQAKTMKAGELNFMQRDLVKLSKIAEGLTNDELLAAQYLVENRFPKAFSDAQIETLKKNEKLGELVDTIKNLMAYVGKEEQAAGLLGKLRDDYFPHVMKFNNTKWDDFVKKYEDDKDLGGLIGKSQANSFTKQRTGLPTLAELDDALASLQTKLEDATNEKAIKGLSGKIKELEEMFNRNTLQAVASRVYTSARSRAMRQLYTQMRKDRLLRYTVPSKNKEDFVSITRDEANALGFPKIREGASILYIQKDLMDALKRTEDIFTDKGLNTLLTNIDDVMRLWRLSTTVMIPKHYVNNLIGNVFNNMLAGVNPAEYKNAAKVLSDMRKGKLSASDQELVKQAYRDGIIGQGHNVEFDIFADPAKIKTWAQRTNEKVRSWGYTKALMYAGQWIDDASRLALYMDSLKKTRSPKIAADRVREYLFNYHEVTKADRLVRTILMPFWLWTKNNLPLQMKNLFTNPRVYTLTENIRRATFDDQDFADDPEFIREKYIQNFLGQKVPFSLPMYDVNKIEGFTGTIGNFISDLGPIPRFGFELAANKEFFSNAKIYKEGKMNEDEKTASIVAYLTKAFGGQVGSWVVDTYKKVIKDDKLTPEEQIARITSSYLYGMPYYEK